MYISLSPKSVSLYLDLVDSSSLCSCDADGTAEFGSGWVRGLAVGSLQWSLISHSNLCHSLPSNSHVIGLKWEAGARFVYVTDCWWRRDKATMLPSFCWLTSKRRPLVYRLNGLNAAWYSIPDSVLNGTGNIEWTWMKLNACSCALGVGSPCESLCLALFCPGLCLAGFFSVWPQRAYWMPMMSHSSDWSLGITVGGREYRAATSPRQREYIVPTRTHTHTNC